MPEDVSIAVKNDYEEGWDHSISYLTLKEILEFDWTQTVTLFGVVNGVEYFKWTAWRKDRGESPESYCSAIVGSKIVHVSVEEMDKLIAAIKEKTVNYHDQLKIVEAELENTYCRVEWEQPYYKTCRSFWSDIIPQLLRIGKPEDVRLVFWFDN